MSRLARTFASCAALVALVAAPVASAADARDVATAYVRDNPAKFGVTRADVAELGVTSAYRSSHNGVAHVNLNQRFEGLEVFGAHATVNVTGGKVVFTGGGFVRDLRVANDVAPLGATDAAEAAAEALDLGEPEGLSVLRAAVAGAHGTLLSDGGISEAPIPARLGWQPTKAGLRLSWQLEIDDATDVHYWEATIDARTGRLLDVQNLTIEDEHEELAATLARGGGTTPPPPLPAPDARSENPVDDGSSYRVYEITKESPNDGERTLVSSPADGTASPWGWHDTDAAPGPEFTTTRGNNVHAYLDQDNNNAPDFGFDVDGGLGLDFDFGADLTQHAQNYREAVVTNLFYWNNVIHDVMYLYGFDEVSGNFQATNYRGGPTAGNGQGDYVRAEAADGGGTNNANFNTGASRMQMFLWPGNQFGAQNQVVVDDVGAFDARWARFSPAPTPAGTSGRIIDAGNGCAAVDYAAAPAGAWMAIVTGGNTGCQNIAKARAAEAAGANALVVAHTTEAAAPILTGAITAASPAPGIPVASITRADGDTIRAAVAAGPTTGTVRKHPGHPGIRDGDFESGIIIHEYGHGVSIRLTGGPTTSCLSGNEQAGEGWSDYLAITMLLDPRLDDPEGPRGMGPYALFQGSRQGNGIRPRPYSRNMAIQPFTYDSIKTGGWLPNAEGNPGTLALPHGLGHGWAAVLWDITWDLIDKHGFNPNVYGAWNTGGNNRALQYVIDGLKLQGCTPTLLRSARAVIEAANLLGGGSAGDVAGDACTVHAGFARRGFGYSAVDGTTNRDDNEEAFDTHPSCRRGFHAPVTAPYGALNTAVAGDTVPLRFSDSGLSGLDILARNNPYSRLVDCDTLRTVDTSYPFITPRPLPIPTQTPGNSGLMLSATGQYHYNWQTLSEWAGTCREVVVTRKDGRQHRAFFRFVAG